MPKTLGELLREVGVEPSARDQYISSIRRPPLRGAYWERPPPPPTPQEQQRQFREALGRERVQGQLQRSEAYDPGIDPNTGMTQAQEALLFHLEPTGAPSLVRSYNSFRDGDMVGGVGHGALGGLAVLGNAAAFAPARQAARAPMRGALEPPAPTPIYRGLIQEHDAERAALLGDRWWHTNPQVASSYAPGSNGAHVVPGLLDESSTRLVHIRAPAGTDSRAIPIESLPPELRRAFPRSATHANSHEVAAAAETAGYDGVTFAGIRDSGYAAAMDGPYPGFETGDDGRTVALFRDDAVRSPFAQSSGALEPPTRLPVNPTREIAPNGLPIRPSQPFRTSLNGGSDDLASAAAMQRAPDAGSGRGGQLYHGTSRDYDWFDLSAPPSRTGVRPGESRAVWLTSDEAQGMDFARLQQLNEGGTPRVIRADGVDGRILTHNAWGALYDDVPVTKILERARRQGYAGVRFRNMREDVGDGPVPDQIAVFDAASIRRPPSSGAERMPRGTQADEMVIPVVHSTRADFERFDPAQIGSRNGDPGWRGRGFYFYRDTPEFRARYSGNEYAAGAERGFGYGDVWEPVDPQNWLTGPQRAAEGSRTVLANFHPRKLITDADMENPAIARAFAEAGYEGVERHARTGAPMRVRHPGIVRGREFEAADAEAFARAAERLGYDGGDLGGEIVVFPHATDRIRPRFSAPTAPDGGGGPKQNQKLSARRKAGFFMPTRRP